MLPLQLKPLPPIIQRLLLAAATVPSLPIVFPRLAKAAMDKSGSAKSLLSQAATMIGISGVSPAVLGVVATLLRGLQLTTPLRNIFNPTAGVAAGVSVGGAVIDRQWVGLMVACWVGSEPLWRLLGA
ncbi:hypothetical protein TeGR_g9493 [Tetraparma gracilis]|uniref:Uncharacterized protein n=1 Tax=Tetraparma gracilis TaxID=2962635 RepID=A0ABQ6N5R9_9STRA|nr:hypothetical protein TeGR_g9493 [Tetraparma gracilis]